MSTDEQPHAASVHARSRPPRARRSSWSSPRRRCRSIKTATFHAERRRRLRRALVGFERPGYSYSRLENPTADAMAGGLRGGPRGRAAGFAFGSGMGAIHAVPAGAWSRAGDRIVCDPGDLRQHPCPAGARPADATGRGGRSSSTPSTSMRSRRALSEADRTARALRRDHRQPHDRGRGPRAVSQSWPIAHGAQRRRGQHLRLALHLRPARARRRRGRRVGDQVAERPFRRRSPAPSPARASFIDHVREVAIDTGGIVSPFAAFLVLRGLQTLHVRMDRHSATGLALARQLEDAPGVLARGLSGSGQPPTVGRGPAPAAPRWRHARAGAAVAGGCRGLHRRPHHPARHGHAGQRRDLRRPPADRDPSAAQR